MTGTLAGKVAIVTGAARGIGRSEAIALASEGCHVVINDLISAPDQTETAESAVAEIVAAGGTAEVNHDDISDWAGAGRLIAQAVAVDGHLDILVCNAGNLRDRTLVKMSEEEWDAVIKVHLKGHFAPLHFAAEHWRDRSRAGEAVDARVITTSSEAGLYGHFGQVNYSTAKAGIVSMTLVAARELAQFGVKANSICPRARTAMTAGVVPDMDVKVDGIDDWDPLAIGTAATFLAGPHADDITGQVFVVHGATITRLAVWAPLTEVRGTSAWTVESLAAAKDQLAGSEGFALEEFDVLMNRSPE